MDGNLYGKDGTRLIQYATGKTQKSFVVPDGVTAIEYGAFQNAKRLKEIILPSTITQIGAWAFSGCSNLIKINLPNGIKKIDEKTFENCKKLQEIIPYLRDQEALNKVIWKVYYEKPTSDMIGRIIGNERKTGIYKLTNTINQMCYVGQAVDVASRWK